ncbi:hypothetical protein TPHA_0F00470 [Tetrapisispora phaffii CBS 4417]|uniref:Cleavage stimulation factor subunit 2 hinge domain-containing protein n=1 Tax=Tetrapisispora phaffii (strain ATCC 24235 / CBS 4417 / NBRC 1672 / NRRL Y-8282 / UCD 70-5) TaxID=1071381 RepID=G8BUV2_TETPH|nr:hypothetical protein TPHA_0F00470 [Tetrapisispora phaffii CBS 4417]CCE63534.1 hypothetical protein TPHA_0F00470 [Tetrapisispora phaffii CBS 4417]
MKNLLRIICGDIVFFFSAFEERPSIRLETVKTRLTMTDPRTRTGRHTMTFETLASAVEITNIPQEWTTETITSVVVGSGPIVHFSSKLEPRTGKLNSVIIHYKTAKECQRAFHLLEKIDRFPCFLKRIIPQDVLLNGVNEDEQKDEIQLTRDNYPWDAGLELPFEMITEVPLSRRPLQPKPQMPVSNENVTIPDILSKASQQLPPLQEDILSKADAVSKNLSKIPPLQLIEIISNLKILASQDATRRTQLENFLRTNLDISISVTQAMLEIGLINYDVVTQVMKKHMDSSNVSNYSGTNMTMNGTRMPMNMAPVPPIGMPNMQQPHFIPKNPQMPFTPPAFNNINSYPFMGQSAMPQMPQLSQRSQIPQIPQIPQVSRMQPVAQIPQMPQMSQMPQMPQMTQMPQMPQMTQMPQMSPPPMQPSPPSINYGKLNALPSDQQTMIKQVLELTPKQITLLPEDQRIMVTNLQNEYRI